MGNCTNNNKTMAGNNNHIEVRNKVAEQKLRREYQATSSR